MSPADRRMSSEAPSSGRSSPIDDHSPDDDLDRSENGRHGDDKGDQPPRKRQRVRLSCLECRRRKLSCDRGFPCERCIKSGTPERCTYETRPGLAPPAKNGLSLGALSNFDSRISAFTSGHNPIGPGGSTNGGSYLNDGGIVPPYHRDSHRSATGPSGLMEGDRMRRLELEVSQLKSLLASAVGANGSLSKLLTPSDGSATLNDDESPQDKQDGNQAPSPPSTFVQTIYGPRGAAAMQVGDELRFFRGKEFKTRYFGPHNACMAFSELTGLCPFMKETAEEWLRPLHVHHNYSKDRQKRKVDREVRFSQPDPELEALLPDRQEMDVLVNIYLDQFEQVHRIVHIPSFRREYAAFWEPGHEQRTPAFTALLLSVMSISSCLRGNPTGKFIGMISQSHHLAEKWITACEAWSQRQSQKHRKLVHYQIACLTYLAKRVNTMKKKRFWKASGALTQDAVSVGLHREPSHIHDSVSVYNQEMRRRIWATIQEFDMQASFDHGLPTLLSALRFDVHPPRNLADEDFDENTTELPQSRPTDEYTFSSYQHLSRQSLPLRLQLSRVLTGPPDDLDYDQVIRYTNDITQEIDALPSWDVRTVPSNVGANGEAGDDDDSYSTSSGTHLTPLLAYTLLHIQLRQYIIPLHQPYLKLRKTNSKYQYSEIIYYNAARDMVLLHDKLAEQGIRTLNFLREDALTLSINLCSVTMLQSRGSTNMIMVNSQHTKKLLEKCLAMKEDRVLRCGNNEPWGYSIMCAATGLLEAHLGDKTPEAAKASSAERFVNLHYKLLARQEQQPGGPSAGDTGTNGTGANGTHGTNGTNGTNGATQALLNGNSEHQDDEQQQQQPLPRLHQLQAPRDSRLARTMHPMQTTMTGHASASAQAQTQARVQQGLMASLSAHTSGAAAASAAATTMNSSSKLRSLLNGGPDVAKASTAAQSLTPYMPMTQAQAQAQATSATTAATGIVAGLASPDVAGPPAAWWVSNIANMSSIANPNADPTVHPPRLSHTVSPFPLTAAQQLQVPAVNPDFNYELLGLNLGELWADYSWEDI